MTRITMIMITIYLCITSNIFSQERINDPLPIVSYEGKELKSITGWAKDINGQWQSLPNVIPDGYGSRVGKDNIVSMKIYNVEYNDKKFIVLEKISKEGHYQYPTIYEGYIVMEIVNYYIFEKEKFVIKISQNLEYDNKLSLYNYTESSYYDNRKKLSETLGPYLKDPKYSFLGFSNMSKKEFLEIPTYYYAKDNVVRFVVNNGKYIYYSSNSLNKLPEDFYFECDSKIFIGFFNATIE